MIICSSLQQYMSDKIQLAPWESTKEQNPSICLIQKQDYQYKPTRKETTDVLPTCAKQVKISATMPKLSKRYEHILPRVYEKVPTEDSSHEIRPVLHQELDKIINKKIQPFGKIMSKNELVIHFSEDQSQLPKMQIEHPIKHAVKHIKLATIHQEYQTQRQSKQRIEDFYPYREKIRRRSFDISNNHRESSRNILKKLSNYEQAIIKKCSLKNLQVYEKQEKHFRPQRQRKEDIHQKVKMKPQKKHILDRILSRFQ